MATAITNTPQNITGDFDLCVRGNATDIQKKVSLQKSLGTSTTNWVTLKVVGGQTHDFVKNVGTNSYRLAEDIAGITVEFQQ